MRFLFSLRYWYFFLAGLAVCFIPATTPARIPYNSTAFSSHKSNLDSENITAGCPSLTWTHSSSFEALPGLLKEQKASLNKSTLNASKPHLYPRLYSKPLTRRQRRNNKRRPASVNPNSLPPSTDHIFEGESTLWKQHYDKGVQLWKYLQSNLTHLPYTQCPRALQGRWNTVRKTSWSFLSRFSKECKPNGIFGKLDHEENKDTEPEETICANSYTYVYQSTEESLPSTSRDRFEYSNWYSPFSGTIAADFNTARIQAGSGEWWKAPNNWAEVVFLSWHSLCQVQRIPRSALRYIARVKVANHITEGIAHQIYAGDDNTPRPIFDSSNDGKAEEDDSKIVHLDFQPNQPDFYALLGTPNGSGVGRLLSKYANPLATRAPPGSDTIVHVKTIRKITMAYEPEDISLGFILEDRDLPPGFTLRLPPSDTLVPNLSIRPRGKG